MEIIWFIYFGRNVAMPFKFDVFLSHNSKDKLEILKFRDELVSLGMRVWVDVNELRPGMPWQVALEEGIKETAGLAVFIGTNGIGPWQEEEMRAALAIAVREKRPVIPVVLPGVEDCDNLSLFLANRTWVDARKSERKEVLDRISWGITGKKPRKRLGAQTAVKQGTRKASSGAIPAPPARYAVPDYIGSHDFVGRDSQLQELSDWAAAADPTNLLLFEAIGGNGKSMLTWEWVSRHALKARPDWAGRFWYSFYERGAVMSDFCRRALAYMTRRPLKDFDGRKTVELAEELIGELHAAPWLVVLDGLERVLVHYHRIDAAELPDEAADQPTDKIARRDPCNAIREEDNDLLRRLAGAVPSKVLVSSRLTPRVLLNASGQTIQGAKRIALPGLRPVDAEKLLRSCGIEGNSANIQKYLTANCDNHPLVIGVVAGLINDYLPDRANFDAWSADSNAGGSLDVGNIDLIQRRNHILHAAIAALPAKGKELLSTLSLLVESIDYPMLEAFNPHIPPEPDKVSEPEVPEKSRDGSEVSQEEEGEAQEAYKLELARWQEYEAALQEWRNSSEYRLAPERLKETVRDLERRGLLQYDRGRKRHDLHPVVRAVARRATEKPEQARLGERVIDYFSTMAHNPYEKATNLDDLRPGLNVVRTLLKLGRLQDAGEICLGPLLNALLFTLEAHAEAIELLQQFFPDGWGKMPVAIEASLASSLATCSEIALDSIDGYEAASHLHNAMIRFDLERQDMSGLQIDLHNLSVSLWTRSKFVKSLRLSEMSLSLASLTINKEAIFISHLVMFESLSVLGRWEEAEATWRILDPMGRDWSWGRYRPGTAEDNFVWHEYRKGEPQESALLTAERLAANGNNRASVRRLKCLRGTWRLAQGEWKLAAESFQEGIRMARERGLSDHESETGLAIANFQLGQLPNAWEEARRLGEQHDLGPSAHRNLALLWRALGCLEKAKDHALASYRTAWSDGEPYVDRFGLTRAAELLTDLQVSIPTLPPYDSSKDPKFDWEDDVLQAIEKLKKEKEAKSAKKKKKPAAPE